MNAFRLPLMLLLATLAAAGCDSRPRRVPVAGQVLVDGEPLRKGFVRLIPSDGRAATGEIQNGRFRLSTFDPNDGCLLGTHVVEVIAIEPVGMTGTRRLVPKKYNSALTSDKTATIAGPTDELVIESSWDGGGPYVEISDSGGDVDENAPLPARPQPKGPPADEASPSAAPAPAPPAVPAAAPSDSERRS